MSALESYLVLILTTDNLTRKYNFHGFPVVRDAELVGYVTRDKLLESFFAREPATLSTRRCTFSSRRSAAEDNLENLSSLVEEAILQLRKEQPQELVVDMFQKLVSITSYSRDPYLMLWWHRTFDRFYSRTKED